MKKISKYFIALVAVIIGAVTLASCSSDYDGTVQDFLNRLVLSEDRTEVAEDFTLPGSVTIEGTTVPVTWSENAENFAIVANEDGTYTADITQAEEDQVVTFTASMTYKDETATKEFKIRIAAIVSPLDFYDVEDGSAVSITGYVAYLGEYSPSYSNFSLYLIDSTYAAGFYGYRVSATQAVYDSLSVGQQVTVSGEKDTYSKGEQIASGSITVIDTLPAYQAPAALNINDILTASDAESQLKYLQGRYVEVTGAVVDNVNGYNASGSTSQTLLSANVGEAAIDVAFNGYLFEGSRATQGQALGAAVSAASQNDVVTVRGYLSRFNDSWQIALVSADDFTITEEGAETLESVEAAAVAAVEASMENLQAIVSNENPLKDMQLYQSDDERVVIEWRPNGKVSQQYLTTDGNVLHWIDGVALPTEVTEIEVRAEIIIDDEVLGSNTDKYGNGEYVDFTIIVKDVFTTWEEYYYSPAGATVSAEGTVYAVGWSKNEKNNLGRGMALVQNEQGGFYVMQYDVEETAWKEKFAVNNIVSFEGEKDSYHGKHEILPTSLNDVKVTGTDADGVTPIDITEALVNGNDLSVYQGMYVTVTGGTYRGGSLVVSNATKKASLAVYADRYFYEIPNNGLEANGIYTISGYMNCYDNLQISPVKASDINKTGQVEVEYDALMEYTGSTTTNMSADENNASLVGLDSKVFTVTSAKKSTSNEIGLNKAGNIRLYANKGEGDGCELTVSVKDKTIAKIVINFVSNTPAALLSVTGLSENVTANGSAPLTVEYAEAVSTFTIKNVTTDSSNQAHISSIEIYFAE